MILRFVGVVFLLAGSCLAQAPEREEVTVSPDILARYVGVYAMAPAGNMIISLADGQLNARLSGQGKLPVFAESDTKFFYKVVDADIQFPGGEKGPASQLIFHQRGRNIITAKRLEDAEAKKVTDAAAAFDKRFEDQTAAPGSEAAVRRMIGELQTGKPNYDLMSQGLADATRQQLDGIQSTLNGLGALQSVTFKGVGPGGADIYTVKFEQGSLDYRVWLAPDGKAVDAANMGPSQ